MELQRYNKAQREIGKALNLNTSNATYKDVDEYITKADSSVRDILQKIRSTVKINAPNSVESISYGMPAYKLNGKPLVYFAAFPKHIGFYATPDGHETFEEQLSKYKRGKGSVQFPVDQAIPYDLIGRITAYKNELLAK